MTSESRNRLILLFAAVFPSMLVVAMAIRVLMSHISVHLNDSFALWTYPVIARLHGASVLYDMPSLHAAQVALGMPGREHNPFPFPPTFLLLLWPLGALPYL